MIKHNLEAKQYRGLTQSEADKRLMAEGYNELKSVHKKGWMELFFSVASEPIILLILICSWLYLILGDHKEALALLFSIVLVIVIEIFQSLKTERAIEALRDLSSPRALVIRNGKSQRIPGREVVRGDLVILTEGDRVPADGVLVDGANLMIDESILTGESLAVTKSVDNEALAMASPGGEKSPYVYASSLVVTGRGVMKVLATGMQTEVGRIGESLNKIKPQKTKLQQEIKSLVKILGAIGVVLCVLVFVIYGYTTKEWLIGLLYGLSLAMSVLPQEFPVILVIFMALGAWRMSHYKVLARQQKAIQALGSVTQLCVDKTGTLTMNQQTLTAVNVGSGAVLLKLDQIIAQEFKELLRYSVLACHFDSSDPLEKAILNQNKVGVGSQLVDWRDYKLVKEYALTESLLSVSYVWQFKKQRSTLVSAKGAPETIFQLCNLSEELKIRWMKEVDKMAESGWRVLAVARARADLNLLPEEQNDFKFEMLGLIAFVDPVRPGVKDAVKECYRAGIKITMITGDYPATAMNIGRQIGLDLSHGFLTGEMIEGMKFNDLKHRIAQVSVIARVAPDQKLKIVEAFKSMNEIVVMTGDGVNDAPALKSAHVGVAMGSRGTDVAREAAGIVLVDDNFNSIVKGVRQGRRIFDNIRKAMMYVMSIHMVTGAFTLLAVIFQWPLMLLPLHLAFLELIVDPTSSVAFEAEAEEDDVMSRQPRPSNERIFNGRSIRLAVLQGMWLLLVVVLVFKYFFDAGYQHEVIRSLVFCTLIFGNLGLIIANRSTTRPFWTRVDSPNKALTVVLLSAVALMLMVIYTPANQLFKVVPLLWWQFMLTALAGIVVIIWSEIWKYIINKLER